jgi:hypothetical protein
MIRLTKTPELWFDEKQAKKIKIDPYFIIYCTKTNNIVLFKAWREGFRRFYYTCYKIVSPKEIAGLIVGKLDYDGKAISKIIKQFSSDYKEEIKEEVERIMEEYNKNEI